MSLSVMVARTDAFSARPVLQQKQVNYDEFINNCLMLQYYWQHAKYNRTIKKMYNMEIKTGFFFY